MRVSSRLNRFFLNVILVCVAITPATSAQKMTPRKSVSPFIGTGGHGHTFPGATVPFGMVQLSPDTRVEGWDACGGYYHADTTILGFSHTHLSGTGIADYGDILVTPFSGVLKTSAGYHPLRFTHAGESASPGYYKVRFPDEGITAELTASTRVGVHRYTFKAGEQRSILLNLLHGLGPDRVVESSLRKISDREIAGMRRSAGWASDQLLYFVARFSDPIKTSAFYRNDSLVDGTAIDGTNLKIALGFGSSKKPLGIKVALSSVSEEGARKNLDKETPGWDFDAIRSKAERLWDKELRKITIQGGTPVQRTTFYTALYHAMIAPNVYSDVDGSYRGMDREIHAAKDFTMYTVFSLWDTFRGEHPLMTILDENRTRDFVKSLLAKYDEGGTLPMWELASNETWCMIGYHAVPVIADAFLKGIGGFDANHALDAMVHSADADRYGLKWYRESGFVPAERDAESVSKTLEYAYDDWCIARMAEKLGRTDISKRFYERAQFYKNLFDPSTGFMRPRMNGAWDSPFDPAAVTNNYTEANPWQYSFFVPQDIAGLISLHGGVEPFTQKLDTLFFGSSALSGREQADITGLIGKYAQGNEPSHHAAYLYELAGQPWKTQSLVRKIMDSLYTDKPDGLCGNDDCGQMSAWYVLSALGFYSANPASGVYEIGSPVFEEIAIHGSDNRTFIIRAKNNSRDNVYIQSAILNGRDYSYPANLSHDLITQGGMLELVMGPKSSLIWGRSLTDPRISQLPRFPPEHRLSENHGSFAIPPIISATSKTFEDSLIVTLSAVHDPDTEAKSVLHYTIDGSTPDVDSKVYAVPIVLRSTSTVSAIDCPRSGQASKVASASFVRSEWKGTLHLNSTYAQQYTGGGANALIDGVIGETDFRLGAWQGYEEHDLDAVLDLGAEKEIDSIGLRCLQDNNSWIFFPTEVRFSFSVDGVHFGDSLVVTNQVSPKELQAQIQEFSCQPKLGHSRYIKIHANNIGHCPPWHRGAGGKAWLFVDEIILKSR